MDLPKSSSLERPIAYFWIRVDRGPFMCAYRGLYSVLSCLGMTVLICLFRWLAGLKVGTITSINHKIQPLKVIDTASVVVGI